MSTTRSSMTQRRRTRPWLRWILLAALVAGAFLLGVAFARTLDERPREGGLVTTIQTLPSLPAGEQTTVTVTVTAP